MEPAPGARARTEAGWPSKTHSARSCIKGVQGRRGERSRNWLQVEHHKLELTLR